MIMIENKYCKCGQPIDIEHGVHERTMRTDGMRFYYPGSLNDRSCLFRCPNCNVVVEYKNLIELGEF